MKTNNIILGDCIEQMKLLPDNSIDAIITDPPYGLGFMGKEWDTMDSSQFGIAGNEGDNDLKVKKNFKILPRIAEGRELQKFTNDWASECLRVLKPGGYLLSFGGTRTYHRMTCGIEDAGFEIRDCIMWLYGSGFPKSLNIGKQIDKYYGRIGFDLSQIKLKLKELFEKSGKSLAQIDSECNFRASGYLRIEHRDDDGWGEALPTLEKWDVIKKVINCEEELSKKIGEYFKKAEREIVGKGRAGFLEKNEIFELDNKGYGDYNLTKSKTPEGTEWEGWGTALKPAVEPIVVARKPLSEKNVALNVLKWGTGGINIDESRIGTDLIPCSNDIRSLQKWKEQDGRNHKELINPEPTFNQGRFPANIIFDEEAGQMLDEQSGESNSIQSKRGIGGFAGGLFEGGEVSDYKRGHNDKGGASRFFMNIPKENIYKYCPLCYIALDKDSKEEWKNITVNNAEKNLITTQVIKEDIVLKNVMQIPRERLDQIVKSVGNLCQKCTTDFVQSLVVILEIQKDVQSQEELQVIQDFITNSKKCILFQNLVSYVEILDSIDTTQITQNLLKLFGSVNLAITNYIQEIEKIEPLRFKYTAKASKSERNEGMGDMQEVRYEDKIGGGLMATVSGDSRNGAITIQKNNHPTVKPIKLIEYLIKLVSREGSIILDPFLGSGTTAIACLKTNRMFIGIEKESDYVKIAEARIKPYLEQTKL